MSDGFTPTEQRMLGVLADGHPHTREELHACLDDELSSKSAVKQHLSNIRKHLRLVGQEIICEWKDRQYQYRQVRLINTKE